MKRNMTIFPAGGIPFGIVIGIVNSYRYGPYAGLISGMAAGLFFGFVMYIILGLHRKSVRKIGDGKFRDETAIHHFRNINLNLPFDRAFDLCIESLSLINSCTIRNADRMNGKIIAKAGLNWRTWSDTITFTIRSRGDGRTDVELSSRPTARTTIIDFGKNLENVETIISFLTQVHAFS